MKLENEKFTLNTSSKIVLDYAVPSMRNSLDFLYSTKIGLNIQSAALGYNLSQKMRQTQR